MPASSPTERALQARLAAHTKWASCDNPTNETAPARAAFDRQFVEQVDPAGTLSPTELARRVEHARKAYFARLALKSAQARRVKKPVAQ